jgi:hypothetical protein
MDKLREADAIVDSLGKAMQSGETGLRYVPALLIRVIDEGLWRKRVIAKTGQVAEFETFLEFVITEPLEGLGADLGTLKSLCRDNKAALDAIDKVTAFPTGTNQYSKGFDNVKSLGIEAPVGNSADYALRKLRADAPELHQRVIAGELSPHAAMKEAGFRKKTVSIPVDDVRAIARTLARHLTVDQIEELTSILAGER